MNWNSYEISLIFLTDFFILSVLTQLWQRRFLPSFYINQSGLYCVLCTVAIYELWSAMVGILWRVMHANYY